MFVCVSCCYVFVRVCLHLCVCVFAFVFVCACVAICVHCVITLCVCVSYVCGSLRLLLYVLVVGGLYLYLIGMCMYLSVVVRARVCVRASVFICFLLVQVLVFANLCMLSVRVCVRVIGWVCLRLCRCCAAVCGSVLRVN